MVNDKTKLIVQSKEMEIEGFKIPPMEISEGEIIGVHLCGGGHFFGLQQNLVELLTEQKTNPNLEVYQKIEFVEHFRESRIKSTFFPTTVEKYLEINGRKQSAELERIYQIDCIKPNTKVKTLAGNPLKWISLFTTFSRINNIIFDLIGQDPSGAEQTINYVKEFVKKRRLSYFIRCI